MNRSTAGGRLDSTVISVMTEMCDESERESSRASAHLRHCERSAAIQCSVATNAGLDCRVAPLLAMTARAVLVRATGTSIGLRTRPDLKIHRRHAALVVARTGGCAGREDLVEARQFLA